MIFIIIDYLKIILIILPFVYILFLLVQRDLNEVPPVEKEVESDEAKTVTEVVYYENLSLIEKYKKLIGELDKIKNLLPCNEKLNDFRGCITEIMELKHKADRMYHVELVKFDNAVSWLEKPLVTRGKYKPAVVAFDGVDFDGITMETVDKAVQLIIKNEMCNKNILENANYLTTDKGNNNVVNTSEKITENAIPAAKIDLLKIPDINLEQLLEIRCVVDRLWTLAKIWSSKLVFEIMESIKVWFVVLMILQCSIFTVKNMSRAHVLLSALLSKFIIIQIEANIRGDTTIVILTLFPSPDTERVQRKGLYRILDLWDWVTQKL